MVSVDRHFINFLGRLYVSGKKSKRRNFEIQTRKWLLNNNSNDKKKTDLKKAKIKFGILFNLDTIIFISLFWCLRFLRKNSRLQRPMKNPIFKKSYFLGNIYNVRHRMWSQLYIWSSDFSLILHKNGDWKAQNSCT